MAGRAPLRLGAVWVVNSSKAFVSSGGFTEADSFIRLGWARQVATGHGLASFGLSTAGGVFERGCLLMRSASLRHGVLGRGELWSAMARLGMVWADNSLKHRVRCLGMR